MSDRIAKEDFVTSAVGALSSVYQPVDSDLTAIAALATTSFGRSLLTSANAAALVASAGLDADLTTFSVPASTTVSAFGASLVDDANAATALGTLGAQPLDSDLTAIAAIAPANDDLIQRKSGAWTNRTLTQVKTDLGLVAGLLTADSFNRANGALGNTDGAGSLDPVAWTVTGALDIFSNQVETGTGNGTAIINLGVADHDAQIVIADGTGAASLLWRYTDSSNHWRIDISGPFQANSWTIYKVVTGGFTQVATGSGAPNGSVWRAVVTGSSVTVYRDSTVLYSGTDSTHSTATRAGFNLGNSGARADGWSASTVASTLAAYQPLDSDLTAIAALTTTTFGRSLLALANAAALISAAGLDADLATFSVPASTTISTFGASLVDDANAAAALTTLGAQPLDADLTTIAGLTATTDNMIQSVGSAWASRTPTQVKAALVIAESDVTNLTTDLTDLQTQTALNAAKAVVTGAAQAGWHVVGAQGSTSCALSPNATPTKLDLAAGTLEVGTDECTVAAQSAISTTIASLADATNPKWVIVEASVSAGATTINFNAGTAAAAPAFPTLTTSRVPLGFLYVPANATNVDTLLTTVNGLAKLIDCRVLRRAPARIVASDTSNPSLTNPTALTAITTLTAAIPANSIRVGDVFEICVSGTAILATATTLRIVISGLGCFDYTTISLDAHATNNHRWAAHARLQITSVGSGTSANANVESDGQFSNSSANVNVAVADSTVRSGALSTGFNSTADMNLGVSAQLGTGNASSTVTVRQFYVTKIPA